MCFLVFLNILFVSLKCSHWIEFRTGRVGLYQHPLYTPYLPNIGVVGCTQAPKPKPNLKILLNQPKIDSTLLKIFSVILQRIYG